MTPLPIDPLLPKIVQLVRSEPIVLLEAEPGAGKTTRIPPALLRAGLSDVVVLEPRRLAVRLAARRVAEETGQRLGETVGYQVRFEEVAGERTRLLFVTEGVFTRKLLSGGLERLRVAVLDEFHERHLETDLALALLRKLQRKQPELRILIMSATLGGPALATALRAPLIKVPGRVFPVAVRYTPHSGAPQEEQVAAAVQTVLRSQPGHVLVFLPGAAEINRAVDACQPIARQAGAVALPLHGDLNPSAQDAAVTDAGPRRIVCSTNIAESSITIDGVGAVVDSGFARVLTQSRWTGFSRLEVAKVSQSSAVQRAGRAGRTGPGIAIRLYPESDFVRRPVSIDPEIVRSDLAQLVLQIAAFGFNSQDLEWLDAPPPDLLAHAQDLLGRIAAFDRHRRITPLGRQISALPVHPRLGRFCLTAAEFGAAQDAAMLAARLSEGRSRLDGSGRAAFASDVDALLAVEPGYAVRKLQNQLTASLPYRRTHDEHAIEKALLLAFPDRVAKRRGDGFLLSSGSGAQLDRSSAVHSEFVVAIDIEDRPTNTPLVRIAAPIEPDWLLEFFPERISIDDDVIWNREAERVEQVSRMRYDALIIEESRGPATDASRAAEMLAAKALELGLASWADAEQWDSFKLRVRFAADHGAVVPDDLLPRSIRLLAAALGSLSDLRSAARDGGLLRAAETLLPMRVIDDLAPPHIVLPRGRRVRIEYHDGRPPSVASRLQDFFGMTATPTVARGAVPLVVQLLAPNHRPVQVTTDLVSFWKNLYPQVRRELSRRYPKHPWPENPA